MLYFVSDSHMMRPLVNKASTRLSKAFRPKTQASYTAMFKVFIAFCIHVKVELFKLDVNVVLAFLVCLLHNHGLYGLFDNLKVKYLGFTCIVPYN